METLRRMYVCLIVENERNLWHRNITHSLRAMGIEVYTPKAIGLQESWFASGQGRWGRQDRAELTERILEDVVAKHSRAGVQLFFCYLFPFQFESRLFSALEARGIPTIYFFCDNLSHGQVASGHGRYATLNWVPEATAVGRFADNGCRAMYLPMAANPAVYRPVRMREERVAAFIGTKNPFRRLLLGSMLESGVDLRVYGNGWHPRGRGYYELEMDEDSVLSREYPILPFSERLYDYLAYKRNAVQRILTRGMWPRQEVRRYESLGVRYEPQLQAVAKRAALSLEDYNSLFSQSAVTIGFNDGFDPVLGSYTYTKLRDFEAALAGACLLTQETEDSEMLFSSGTEVMRYRTPEEAAEKAKFLLVRPRVRKQLRAAARKRALAEHTWQHRFRRIFNRMGFAVPGKIR